MEILGSDHEVINHPAVVYELTRQKVIDTLGSRWNGVLTI